MNTDVLIIGAGPTGLMMADQLIRNGVRPAIIEKNPGPARETRALGVQARTLEIYQHLGIADKAIALGHRTQGAHMWVNGKHAARVPLGDIGQGVSPYPFVLILGQDDNEKLLGEVLTSLGGEVRWGHELVALRQLAGRVECDVRRPDGSMEMIEARYVAGCDGARSAVRTLNHIEFVGAPYEHVFFVADVVATGGMAAGELNIYLWKDGFHIFFPMRGANHWRLVGILPMNLRGRDDLTFEQVIPSVRKEAGAGVTFETCSWFSTYRIHHRRAERFRSGNCFLCGDAAHIHSPVGAQGMNTGLQDAYNLAWKLARACQGTAGDALLDTYGAEREPVANRLLSSTDRMFSALVSDNRISGLFRTELVPRLLALAMRTNWMRQLAFRTIAQTGIEYRKSPLSVNEPGLAKDGPHAGDRFPWMRLALSDGAAPSDLFAAFDDTRFNLLVMGQSAGDVAALERQGIKVIVVPNTMENAAVLGRAGAVLPAFYLLRPDCYIGIAGRQLDPARIATYLKL